MSLSVYSPSADKIVHETEVDLVTRSIGTPVHIMQYDKSLPVIAVNLRKNDAKYSLSSSYTVNVRFEKPDRTIVYNPVLGANSTYDTIYFEVSEQMATRYGDARATLEIIYSGDSANTAVFRVIVDRNPVQDGAIESTDEMVVIAQSVDIATSAANNAQISATNAANSATAANNSKNAAATSATNAANSATAANNSKNAAAESATNAAASAAAAEEDASEIRNMRVTANTLNPGSQASASYANGLLTLGIPRGNTGSKGDTGDDGNGISSVTLVSTSGRVKTYRMTFTDGTHFDFSTTDGENGQGSGTLTQITFNGSVYEDDGNGNVTINTSITETDPTVPSWAKQSTKPTYTKSEVGLGNVDNVQQYSASNPPPYPVTSVNGDTGAVTITETDPTVPSWAKASSKPTYTSSEVGAIANPETKSNGQVLTYNGTSGLWEAANSAGGRGAIFTGTCSTAAETAAKVATLDDATGFSLTAGVRIAITFTNNNTATTPTLNVNNTGAKNITYRDRQNTRYSAGGAKWNTWRSDQTLILCYNGSSWVRGDSFAPYSYQSEIVGDGESYGGGDRLFWLSYGLPVNSTTTVGGPYTPIYLNNGVFTQVSSSSLVTRTISSDPSLSSGAWRRVSYLTITPGTWIVTASMHFNQITGGTSDLYASINQGTDNDASNDAGFSYDTAIALTYNYVTTGNTPNLCLSGIANVTGSNDVNLYLHTFCTRNYSIMHSSFTFKAVKII